MEKMIADNAEAVSASSSPATNSDSNTQSSDSNTQNAAKTESNAFNLDLRVAKVLDVKDHPSADRLFIFQCDLGKDSKGKEEKRQIVAGLKKFMTKEDILGKNIILVTNLEPVVLKGERSEGMSLSAEFIKNVDGKKTEKVVLLHAPHSKPGDRVYVEGVKLPKEGTDDYKAYFKTIKFDDFLKYKFVVKNKEVLDTLRNNKHLKTDKEKIKAEIEDGAKVC
jgi:methionine--tRNA ligase beta chain